MKKNIVNMIQRLPVPDVLKKYQIITSIVMTIYILTPIILLPILGMQNIIDNKTIVIIALIWLVDFYGVYKLSEIIRYNGYHQIKNAHTNFQITEVNDDDTIKALYENSALTFFMEPNSLFLDFLYNWFNHEGVIKEKNIKLYVYNGKKLKNVYKYSRVNDSLPLMSIFLKDLKVEYKNMNSFFKNHFIVGARWLDDVIDNDKEYEGTKLLKREDFIKFADSKKIWDKSLNFEEIKSLLERLSNVLNSAEYKDDPNFLNTGRRNTLKEMIISKLSDPNRNPEDAVTDSLYNLWEYVSNDYDGNSLDTARLNGISRVEADNKCSKYRKSGIISLKEKDELLLIMNYIIQYINKN